ncbi:MAG: response regulator transcription factor [Candidatus Lokiarchaeota archaeon]|nr:response regulator transcription factor [Candidatus Lokiarchaeota archaeon]
MRILIIEDEHSLLKILTKRFKEDGFAVDTAKNGIEGQELVEIVSYDCIILDIMLPKKDGFTLLKELRLKKIKTPILILTAKDTVSDRVKGLNLGADDYLVKPFSYDELLARVRALLRRQTDDKENILSIGDLTMDINARAVYRGGKYIELTHKEYSILEYLLRNKGVVLKKSQLAAHVWNYDFNYNSNIVAVYIKLLRRKIDDNFKNKIIHNIRGVGYIIREKNEESDIKS